VDLAEMMGFFQSSMGEATSSTAQDLARGKRTEIDTLNGYVASLGKKLGVATPANFALYALVKLIEEKLVK
jgi:2-dehydropantoate 2-reductase